MNNQQPGATGTWRSLLRAVELLSVYHSGKARGVTPAWHQTPVTLVLGTSRVQTRLLCKSLYPTLHITWPLLQQLSVSILPCMYLACCHLLIISCPCSLTDVSFNSSLYLIADSSAQLQNVPSGYYQSPVYKMGLNSKGILVQQTENCLAV